MIGRAVKLAAVVGIGALAWRWWQRIQAENRAYSSTEPLETQRPGATTGMNSTMGPRVDQVPAQ